MPPIHSALNNVKFCIEQALPASMYDTKRVVKPKTYYNIAKCGKTVDLAAYDKTNPQTVPIVSDSIELKFRGVVKKHVNPLHD